MAKISTFAIILCNCPTLKVINIACILQDFHFSEMCWLPEVHKNQLSEGNTVQHEHELITETALRMKDSFTSKRLAQMWKWNRTLLVGNSMGNSFDSDDDDEINSACDPPGHPSVFDIDEDFVTLSLLDQTKK
ncbi:uncharacterized protein LOC133202784 [Saccostrea echinata]|uniref:uncharacterized protein LOC133202784 n=1 Tax=Saccostrea echinata TaxID=191078 RepID=UPI002A80F7D7|nr:uncharacterized protein LOC133202784 [Saccostrea echinata]